MGALISAGGGKGGGRRLKPRLLYGPLSSHILLGTDCKGGPASADRVMPRGVGGIFVKGEGGGV